jgi:hypothetical protein
MRAASTLLVFCLAFACAACRDAQPPAATQAGSSSTAVLGGYGPGPGNASQSPDATGQAVPAPPAPHGASPRIVRLGADGALAAWVQDGHPVSARWTRDAGWSAAEPLEQIYGEASELQLAGNGQGVAMALWRHTVGSIESLRASRFEAAGGWSVPDVMPGALPGRSQPPHLQMNSDGRAFAVWPSGFDPNEMQSSTHVPGQGWSRAASEPVATAPVPANRAQ